jgi:hypothetical protein
LAAVIGRRQEGVCGDSSPDSMRRR